jgi:hypothetical protein
MLMDNLLRYYESGGCCKEILYLTRALLPEVSVGIWKSSKCLKRLYEVQLEKYLLRDTMVPHPLVPTLALYLNTIQYPLGDTQLTEQVYEQCFGRPDSGLTLGLINFSVKPQLRVMYVERILVEFSRLTEHSNDWFCPAIRLLVDYVNSGADFQPFLADILNIFFKFPDDILSKRNITHALNILVKYV